MSDMCAGLGNLDSWNAAWSIRSVVILPGLQRGRVDAVSQLGIILLDGRNGGALT